MIHVVISGGKKEKKKKKPFHFLVGFMIRKCSEGTNRAMKLGRLNLGIFWKEFSKLWAVLCAL